jgi:hypothetical protein
MKKSMLVLVLPCIANLYCAEAKSDSMCKSGESAVFEFQTKSKKFMGICTGGSGESEYLVYRFGKPGKLELEYPKSADSSFSRFGFRSYLRGGGPENEGLDANYLSFTKDGTKYEIFEERSANAPLPEIGIRIGIPKSKKEVVIKGIPRSIKGTLMPLRDEDRLIHSN